MWFACKSMELKKKEFPGLLDLPFRPVGTWLLSLNPKVIIMGGVLVAVRSSAPCILADSFCSDEGELMMFSFQHFTLIVGYRRPVGFGNWRDTLAEWLHSLGQKPWIVVGDFSDDIHNGDISNIWNSAFGTLISSAAHERGSHDIDAIVVSPQLSHHLDRFKPRPYHEVLAAQVSI